MRDEIQFRFLGQLADEHRMDFYEAARFQYAAARLSVKLDQFRRSGGFTKRVTSATKTDIDLLPSKAGSFEFSIAASAQDHDGFKVPVPLTALWAYIIERVFTPVGASSALDMIDDGALRSEFFALLDENEFEATQGIRLLRQQLDTSGSLSEQESELLSKLISETERRAYLASHRHLFEMISPTQDAELVTMAAPLVAELSVPLRRSAKLAQMRLINDSGSSEILSANRLDAESIESIQIDRDITTIDINVVQYNKESGWGKFRNPYWQGMPSFNLPTDRKARMKTDVVEAMREEKVSASGYIVRSAAGTPIRLMLVDVDLIDEI